jgi:hypothetical protein
MIRKHSEYLQDKSVSQIVVSEDQDSAPEYLQDGCSYSRQPRQTVSKSISDNKGSTLLLRIFPRQEHCIEDDSVEYIKNIEDGFRQTQSIL